MPICPQCHSPNSDNNQFCPLCGTSLTHKTCQHCSSLIPLDLANCPNCGANTHELRYALVHSQSLGDRNSFKFWQQQQYLDRNSRYLISSISSTPTDSLEIFTTDTRPLVKSSLQKLMQNPHQSVPEIALPYLELGRFEPNTNQIYAAIPQIYDAWQCDRSEIIILEDRSSWQVLARSGEREDLCYFQVLYWFDKMAQLWDILKDVGCATSLLVQNNLRLDEDGNFCLQRLYYDDRGLNLSLKLLGQVWHVLLDKFDLVLPESLSLLLNKLIAKEIETTAKLRGQLQSIVTTETERFKNSSIVDPPTTILPLELFNLVDAGDTNIGSTRDCNEDFFAIESHIHKQRNSQKQTIRARGLYIVCDGMGGHLAGEVASAMAVDILQDYFHRHWLEQLPDRDTILQGIHLANERIYQENVNNSATLDRSMGTTLVMALVQNTKVAIASVGDSRLYSIGLKSGLTQLTPDDRVAQREIKRGVDPEIAYALPNARQLTQALGPRDNNFVQPYIDFLELKEDCLLLLCSDGLYDNGIVRLRWQTYLKPLLNPQTNLDLGLKKLIDLAAVENGHDNITAILVHLQLRPLLEPNYYR